VKRYDVTARGGIDETADGTWVRYSDVQKLRGDLMAWAEFQQQLGDARGFRRAAKRCGCTPGTVDMLIREGRS
jgi:hypothetical protein